jgi:cell division protein FtsX
VALLILGAFLLVQVNLQHIVQSTSNELTLSVYLKDGLTARPSPA